MANPYSNLPSKSFWKTAVSEKNAFNLENLYEKKFEISRADRIATAGSCFAQHVGTNLRLRGFNVVDVEPAPSYLSAAEARDSGYGIYSARYGNVYTVRQMLQLLTDARGATVRDEDFLLKNDRYIDLLRPGTESAGYDSLDVAHVECFHRMHDCLQARAAHTVDRFGRHFVRQAGSDSRLPGDVHAGTRLQYTAKHDVANLIDRHARARYRISDDNRAEFSR